MKGITKRKSRYFALRTVIHRDGPKLARKPRRAKAGKNIICHPGRNWYQTINATKIEKLIRKSTNATAIVAAGTTSLGKYTLVIRLALAIRLFEASASPVEKKVQGSIPQRTMRA